MRIRARRSLVRDGQLVPLGYGVYGRAETSRLSGEPILAARGGFIAAARQVLDKLGVPWEPTEAQAAYNAGRSTQVPVNPVIRIKKSRFVRRLKCQDTELRLSDESSRELREVQAYFRLPSIGLVEKDLHVVRAIAALAAIDAAPFALVFGGGTALARAQVGV